LLAKAVTVIGQAGFEKIIKFIGAIALSALLIFWASPNDSWPLEAGLLVIDHTEFELKEGQAKLVWPRPVFPWERFKVVGLPGGDVYFEATGIPNEFIQSQLRCAEHGGCLADQASMHKWRRNTICLYAHNLGNGDSWNLVFCSPVRFSYLMNLKSEGIELENRIQLHKEPESPNFAETEWVSRDGKKTFGRFIGRKGDSIEVELADGKRVRTNLSRLSDASVAIVNGALQIKSEYEINLGKWRRESNRLKSRLTTIHELLMAEAVDWRSTSLSEPIQVSQTVRRPDHSGNNH
jgi:hypothetical protein